MTGVTGDVLTWVYDCQLAQLRRSGAGWRGPLTRHQRLGNRIVVDRNALDVKISPGQAGKSGALKHRQSGLAGLGGEARKTPLFCASLKRRQQGCADPLTRGLRRNVEKLDVPIGPKVAESERVVLATHCDKGLPPIAVSCGQVLKAGAARTPDCPGRRAVVGGSQTINRSAKDLEQVGSIAGFEGADHPQRSSHGAMGLGCQAPVDIDAIVHVGLGTRQRFEGR